MNQFIRLAGILILALAWSSLVSCSGKLNGEIHDAARKGDLAKVKALLEAHPDLIDSKDTNGITPLHFAVDNGNKDMVEFLLAKKAEVNASDKYGTTPLHSAARRGHKDVAELLLANKAEINATNDFGWTPLHEAAIGGHKDVAELLLTDKADINGRNNDGETPLHLVLALATDSRYTPETELGKRNVDMVKLLVASNADVNAKDNNGSTPLDYPASNFRDFGNLLRQHGATNHFH